MLPEQQSSSTETNEKSPDYTKLVRFLLSPLLDAPETLSIDSEESNNNRRVWIRVAFDDAEKGRVVGRGGRNLQAISTVLNAAAQTAGQSVYLEIYGDGRGSGSNQSGDTPQVRRQNHRASNDSGAKGGGKKRSSRSRPSPPKPSPRSPSE
ncbi:MAG: KH domain-containing protein [Oscillatoria sp. PMC 1051.18]|nr:KH domain-containing protein [Oscillatoria sp. PMC 1050.18]MEC5030059.1 KH domain-containing protein [Oscillatoria sp. PMC 1051.18]